jgi:hypothetical protein
MILDLIHNLSFFSYNLEIEFYANILSACLPFVG